MLNGSLWDSDRVRFKHLPTLQDVLCTCEKPLLVRVLAEDGMLGVGSKADAAGSKSARVKIETALDAMCSLCLTEKHGKRILLPSESFVLQAGSLHIVHRMEALVVMRSDLAVLGRLGGGPSKQADVAPDIETLACDIALAPWEQTLGTRVWLGGPWCRRERYAVLARAFWEMTYFGFEYERVLACQSQAKARQLAGASDEDVHAAVLRGMTVSQEVAARRMQWGLAEPDWFMDDYRDRLASRVAQLNDSAHRDLCARAADLDRRLLRKGARPAA